MLKSPIERSLFQQPSAAVLGLFLVSSSVTLLADGGSRSDSECDKRALGPSAEQCPILKAEFLNDNAPYLSCHSSTIAETASGQLAAAWFGGTQERNPDISVWFARQVDGIWQEPIQVAEGFEEGGARNPVLFSAPDGRLFLFYKVGPNAREWLGMMMISTDGGANWSEAERLPEGILGPTKNKPVVLADGSWISPSSKEVLGVGWSLYFEKSDDHGETWQLIGPVDPGVGFDAIQPSVLFHTDRKLEAVCRTKQGTVGMTWSEDQGLTWSPVAATDLPNPNSGTDALTLKDGRQLIVYNHSGHRPDRSGKGPRYPLNLAISEGGVVWNMVCVLESEPCNSGYSYPAIIQSADGLLHITYSWDRKKIKHVVVDPALLQIN